MSAPAESPRLVAMAASSAGRPTLLLVPTALEAARLDALGGLRESLALVETCGFGPVAAAARTAELIERVKPRRAILTNLHSDLDYEALRARLPPHVEPAYDGLGVTLVDGDGA